MLYYQGLTYVPKIIQTELIRRHYNNPLAGHYGIKKTHKLVAQKYYWPLFCQDANDYVKECDICLALKTIWHKLYSDLQFLLILTYRWKNLLIDFVTGLPISTDWKKDSYDLILVIVNWLTKLVHYKLVKVTIDALDLTEVIIDVIVGYHRPLNLIVIERELLFILKFWSLLYYFLGIKWRLFTTFHPQTDGQTERQNSIMEVYLQIFDNFKQNDWVQLFLIAEFTYNNAENANTGYTPFELNCRYHLCVSYEKDLDLCLISKTAKKLSSKL